MNDKKKVSSLTHFRNKKFLEESDIVNLPETEKSILKQIKYGNELVTYGIDGNIICLGFFDGNDYSYIEFYVDEQGKIQVRLV